MNRCVLVSDFDGTITDNDFYSLIQNEYMGPDAPDYWARYAAGEISHFETMKSIFAWAPSDPARLEKMLAETRPDPDFRRAADCLRQQGCDLIIVSAGSSWYIHRVLSAAGVSAAGVHANPGHIEPGAGLVLERPVDSRFYCPEVGIDKAAVVRDALARYQQVAFAGDGPPDLKPALLVDPERRFARGFLARELTKLRQPFRPYNRWSDVVRELTGGCAGL